MHIRKEPLHFIRRSVKNKNKCDIYILCILRIFIRVCILSQHERNIEEH